MQLFLLSLKSELARKVIAHSTGQMLPLITISIYNYVCLLYKRLVVCARARARVIPVEGFYYKNTSLISEWQI